MSKLVTYSIIGFLAYLFFGKAKNIAVAYQNIKVKITRITNIKIGIKNITFNLDLQIHNPTINPITTGTTGIINLVKVHIYGNDGTYIGTATPNNIEIDVPANSFQLITDIPAFVSNSNIPNVISQLSNINNLTTKLEVEILGQTITI